MRCTLGVALLASLSFLAVQAQKTPAKPAVAARVQNPLASLTHFTATMDGGLLKGDPRKLYRSGNLIRIDLDDGQYHVTDLASRTTWAVHPDRCTHVPGPDARSYPFFLFPDAKVERSMTDEKETIDGHSCKIEIATLFPKEDDTLVVKMKLWEAEDLQGFPVKIELSQRTRTITVTYKDVSVEPPDPKLFKLPEKCPDFAADLKVGGKKPAAKPKTPPKKPNP